MFKWLEYNWGYDVVLWFQSWRTDFIGKFFSLFEYCASSLLFLTLIALIYWSIDKRKGRSIALLVLLSGWFNSFFKILLRRPRPYQVFPEGKSLIHPTLKVENFGFPSGHTQSNFTFYLFSALRFKKRWLWILCLFLILLVPFSRMVCGVHYPQDLIGGYLIGGVLMIAFYFLEPFVLKGYKKWGQKFLLPLVIFLLLLFFTVPLFSPHRLYADKSLIEMDAMLFSGILGLYLEHFFIKFDVQASWKRRFVRFLVGMLVALLLYWGLTITFKPLEPAEGENYSSLALGGKFIKYFIVGLWVTAGAPFMFILTGLANRELSSYDK